MWLARLTPYVGRSLYGFTLMATDSPVFPPDSSGRASSPTVIIQQNGHSWTTWALRLAVVALGFSLLANVGMFAAFQDYFANVEPPIERYHSGEEGASEKLLILSASGTIMTPLTERLIEQIDHAAEEEDVKGVLLKVDSPGGFVADSHQIYHALQKLSEKKPVFVHMGRMAASGGYYIAMGAGPKAKIFAEPTTWTGSIGVIIPRYDMTELAQKFGVQSDPLKTGEFKDALSPFRPLTESERGVWENILNQSFEQFIEVIASNRTQLDTAKVKTLATGQIYTAKDALQNGLIDEIGYEEDALEKLKTQAGLSTARVVTYEHPLGVWDVLLGSAQAQGGTDPFRAVMEASVPRAMFYCSWLPPIPR